MKLTDRKGNTLHINKYIATDKQVKDSIDAAIEDGTLAVTDEQVEAAVAKKIDDGSLNGNEVDY